MSRITVDRETYERVFWDRVAILIDKGIDLMIARQQVTTEMHDWSIFGFDTRPDTLDLLEKGIYS